MTWTVDGVRISRVVEHVMPFPVDFFAEATPADVAAEPDLALDFVDAHGRYRTSLHSYLLEADGRRIVVDTCCGNGKERPLLPEFDHRTGPYLADLTSEGFAPDLVDTVVCTHLHLDHTGWNTRLVDGGWVPTFPRARYLLGAADLEEWARSDDPLHAPAFADSVRPVLDAGLVDPVPGDLAVTDAVRLRATPGHTPGHLSVWIGDRCVITGDTLHNPIQCRHPEWTATGDGDPDLARATRGALLEEAASTGALVLGTHFAGSSAGHVVREGGAYRFVPED
ncbi:MBL fold metallo-hydrolase [Pseudonocardia kujensis]|uniref:MBL fold metallo-hydrolase n=1 Tax=Pseudonocardia kujensis TaxID=1128675 RepID=UPI001E2A2C2D|nr:MBL fold metallo-hydrolase [Pseudonocardia kujensis]MCE0762909.1 MBL fold metallo-hydrolase [Pseudonocardia kujensis]